MELATDTAYAELGLAPGATEAEAKAAWRRLASQWHPDRNRTAGAASRMQRINLAFEALRRAGFPADESADPPADAPAADPVNEPSRPPAQDATPPQPRQTITRRVRLTLEEAALGCTKVLRGRSREACADCAGSGRQAAPLACAVCAGVGSLRQRGWYGLFGGLSDCADCAGSGQIQPPCAACAGSGQRRSPGYRVTVRLPPGVRDGDELQVDGRRMRPDQSPGDLLIKVVLQPHPFFTLDADGTLHCELPVSGFAWIAGRPVVVPTPAGLKTLTLDRDKLLHRLPGEGFPLARRGPRGDLLLHIVPSLPETLSTDQQILLDQLVATCAAADTRLADWQQRLRDWQQGRARGEA